MRSVLLPSRTGLAALAFFAPLGAFLAGVAFFPGLPFAGATGARRGARAAFLQALGCSSAAGAGAVAVSSAIFILVSPLAVITAVTTWIALASPESNTILQGGGLGDGVAMIRRIEPECERLLCCGDWNASKRFPKSAMRRSWFGLCSL